MSVNTPIMAVEDDSLFEIAQYDEEASERVAYSDYSYWRSTLRVFLRDRTALIALIVVSLLLSFTIIQPYLPGQKDPNYIHINPDTGMQLRNVQPGRDFIFGSNAIGQDL